MRVNVAIRRRLVPQQALALNDIHEKSSPSAQIRNRGIKKIFPPFTQFYLIPVKIGTIV